MKKLWAGFAAAIVAFGLTAAPAAAASQLEKKAVKILKTVFGPCFAPIYSGKLKDATVVRTSTATKGVVTVEVYLTTIATGKDTTYQFRINTGLGGYKGIPNPGTGIPTNKAAVQLVATCPE